MTEAMSYHDRGAEMAMLGSILSADQPNEAAASLFGIAPADEFWADRPLAEVIASMARAGRPIDPQLLLAELIRSGMVEKIGGGTRIHTMMERAWHPDHAKFYAEAVHEAWRRRSLAQAAVRAIQLVEHPNCDVTDTAIEMMGMAERVYKTTIKQDVAAPQDALEFAQGPSNYDWIVPGLIERLDRVMLVADEGLGKSLIASQVALACAIGLHPFSMAEIEPKRALVVDCEVSPRQQRRRWRWLIDVAENLGRPLQPGMLMVEPRPDGLDLVGPDLPWLKTKVKASRAEIVVIGPLYRLHKHNINDEEVARELVGALDEVRIGSNIALLIEAHAGHAETARGDRKIRPKGSSLFLGWTEFGLGLKPVKGDRRIVDVSRWRGDRDIRSWPTRLRWGTGLSFPWVEAAPDENEWTEPRARPAAPVDEQTALSS